LKREEVQVLLGELNRFFFDMPIGISSQEQEARSNVIMMKNGIAPDTDSESSSASATLSKWLVNYLK